MIAFAVINLKPSTSMMNSGFNLTTIKLVTMVFLPTVIFAQSSQGPIKITWERIYGEEGRETNPCTIARSKKTGDIYIAGTTTPLNPPDDVSSCWIWKLNNGGERIREGKIEWPDQKQKIIPGYTHIKGMMVLDSGELVMAIDFTSERPCLVKIGVDGKVLFTKQITDEKRHVNIRKVVEVSPGNLLLFGQESYGDGIVIKVNSEGEKIWEKAFDSNKMGILNAGIALEDGFALLGVKNPLSDKPGVGDSFLSLIRCDDDGNIKTEREIPGRFGDICVLEGKRYFILHDKLSSSKLTQDIWGSLLDHGFKELSGHKLDMLQPATGQLKVCGKANDIFISSSKNFKPCFLRVKENGSKFITHMDNRSDTLHDNISLICAGDNVMAMMTILTEDMSQKTSIKCLLVCLSAE